MNASQQPGAASIPLRPGFRAGPLTRLGRIYRSREFLLTLLMKDLRVRYKHSTLGFLWALLSPLVQLGIYSFIFVVIAKVRVVNYPAMLLSGLVPWTFFAATLSSSIGCVQENASLVKKLRFPRETLPASIIGVNVVHFLLSAVVLLGFLIILGQYPTPYWLLLPLAMAVLIVLTAGLAFAISSLSVCFPDVGFIVPVLVNLWFFATPIIYPLSLVPERIQPFLRLNPMTPVVELFQGILVVGELPQPTSLAYLALLCVASLWAGLVVFNRYDGRLPDLM